MRSVLASVAFAAFGAACTPAMGADVYGGESYKDPHGWTPDERPRGHGGFYISGTLGYAWVNRDYTRTINREVGIDGKIPADATQAEIDDFTDALTAAGVAHRGDLTPGGNLIIPIAGDVLNFGDSDNANGFVYGAGIQYLFHNGGRFGLSIGADVEAYADGDSKFAHNDAHGKVSNGNIVGDFGCGGDGCAGEKSPFPQSGSASVDRQLDIDLVLMGHLFLTNRLALHAGGGVSFALARVCGDNRSGGTGAIAAAFDTSFCDDDFAIGPMAKVGMQYWLTPDVSLGIDGTAKFHDFQASGNAYNTAGDDIKIYGQSRDTVEADDAVYAVKARLSIKLN